jgi:hypothetical protein
MTVDPRRRLEGQRVAAAQRARRWPCLHCGAAAGEDCDLRVELWPLLPLEGLWWRVHQLRRDTDTAVDPVGFLRSFDP